MNKNEEVRILLTSELLNLDPRIADKRAVLCEILLEIALFRLNQLSTIEEIESEIDRIVQQSHFQETSFYKKVSEECVRRGTVISNEKKFELSETRRKKFIEVYSQVEKTFGEVKNELISSIELEVGEPLEDIIKIDIFDLVMRVLTEEIYDYSIFIARNKLSFEEIISQIEGSNPIKKIEDVLEKELPKDRLLLKHKIIGGIIDYFRILPDKLKKALQIIHSNVVINQILILDPSLIELQKERFSKRRIYLDTNVVLSYLFDAHPHHLVVDEILKSSKEIGVQLFISPATLKELDGQILRAKKNFRLLKTNKIASLIASKGDDVVLATFMNLLRMQPSLQWSSFIVPFESFDEVLLQKDILLENEGVAECEESENEETIRKAISDSKGDSAKPNVIYHDTLNFLLICQLRQIYPPDSYGQTVWLLTLDHSLQFAQRILRGSGIIQNPYCMQISDWGEIVLPVQSAKGYFFDDFIGYLAQARLGAIRDLSLVQMDFIETIRDAQIDVDRLLDLYPNQVVNVITKLQTDRETKLLLSTLDEKKEEEEERKKTQLKFDLILNNAIQDTDPIKELKEEYDKHLQILNKKLDLKDQEVQCIKDQLESTLSYKIKKFFDKLFGK